MFYKITLSTTKFSMNFMSLHIRTPNKAALMSSPSLKHLSTFYNSKYLVEYKKNIKIEATFAEGILIKEYLDLKILLLNLCSGCTTDPSDHAV